MSAYPAPSWMDELQNLQFPHHLAALLMLTLGVSRADVSRIFPSASIEEYLRLSFQEIGKSNVYIDDILGEDYLKRIICEYSDEDIELNINKTSAIWRRDEESHILNVSNYFYENNKNDFKKVWILEDCEIRRNWIREISRDLISGDFINIIIMLPSKTEDIPGWNLIDINGCGESNSDYSFRIMAAIAILGLNYRKKDNPEFTTLLSCLIKKAALFNGCCVQGDDERIQSFGLEYSNKQIVFLQREGRHDLQPKLFHLKFKKAKESIVMKGWVARDKLGDYDEIIKTLLIPLSLTSGSFVRLRLKPVDGIEFQPLRLILPKGWLSLFKKGQVENRGKGSETPFKQKKIGDELEDMYFPAPQDLSDLKKMLNSFSGSRGSRGSRGI